MDQVQVHVISWTITLILFVITLILVKADKPKPQKIFHMILRLFLLITLLTGIGLVFMWHFWSAALIKGALGIILLFLLEMIVTKTRDHERTAIWWIVFVIDIILVFYYGYVVIG